MGRPKIAMNLRPILLLAATAGCGSDSGSAAAEDGFKIKPVAGCEQGWAQPTDRSADRKPARCHDGTVEKSDVVNRSFYDAVAGHQDN